MGDHVSSYQQLDYDEEIKPITNMTTRPINFAD